MLVILLYFAGAYLDDLWVYSIEANIWAKQASPGPSARWKHGMVALGQEIYLYGGEMPQSLYSAELWVYSSVSANWTLVGAVGLQNGHKDPGMTAVGSNVYVFGGLRYTSKGG